MLVLGWPGLGQIAQAQVQSRAGKLVYQERQGEQREGAAQVRDGLPNPELPEVAAEFSSGCVRGTRRQAKLSLSWTKGYRSSNRVGSVRQSPPLRRGLILLEVLSLCRVHISWTLSSVIEMPPFE